MKSLHKFTPTIRKLDLFNGIQSIQELENTICSKWNSKNDYSFRGWAWEVFVEAYLNVIRKSKEVYPASAVPQKFRKEFNLTGKDLGIDGLFIDENGKWASYQAKFRGGRENLQLDELATFYAASEDIPNRYVICNSYDLGDNAKNQKRVWTLRHADFKLLKPKDFKNIWEWIKGQPVVYKQKSPRPHQEEAINANVKGFAKHDRGQTIQACASGKTLESLWTAERIGARDIIIFVPSLFLIAQTYREWKPELRILKDAGFVFVCSHVDPDESNVSIPITTDEWELKSILKSFTGRPRIVISTYQSAEVVSKATKSWLTFDFGFKDEAHKTAGRNGNYFSLPLFDKNISIKKRLFATATPRHVTKKNKEGNFDVVSMDNEKIYGPIFSRLSFSEAIKRGIICDYKIVAVTITSEDVDRQLLKEGETKVRKTHVRTIQVAHQLALAQVYKKFSNGKFKTITYCSTIKQAQSFTADGDEGIATHIPYLDYYGHVSSQQSSTDREKNMESFGQSDHGVIANARCLTEGVDIPSVDCVYFTNPRKSKVDNVQAVGRALRKAPHKKCGYIVVPIFVNIKKGETKEEATQNTNYDALADVILAMRDHDEDMVDKLKYIGQSIGEGKKVKGYIGRTLKKIESIGPSVSMTTLRKRIDTIIVDRLIENWDIMYGKLMAFWKKNGHCNVSRWNEKYSHLGFWVSKQRSKKSSLSKDKISKLNNIGFLWVVYDFLPFEEARKFSRSLKLKTQDEWGEYCKSGKKPDNIPHAPRNVYKEFISIQDWLESDNIGNWNRQFLPFNEAKKLSISLNLKSYKEWAKYWKIHNRPTNIPFSPDNVYRSKGWISWGDWLGTGNVYGEGSPKDFLPFEIARRIVWKQSFANIGEWNSWKKRPYNIPSTPRLQYKNKGWISWMDWFGTKKGFDGSYLSFKDAKKFVISLNLKTQDEWKNYCKSGKKPNDIPTAPWSVYTEWISMGNWIGTGKIADQLKIYLPFKSARVFVRSLKLKNLSEWRIWWRKNQPNNIPSYPNQTYKNRGWNGMNDWLGLPPCPEWERRKIKG